MKTIDQHEADEQRKRVARYRPAPCGIECPQCGEELWAGSGFQLLSLPPRKPVHCFACNWSGSVTA